MIERNGVRSIKRCEVIVLWHSVVRICPVAREWDLGCFVQFTVEVRFAKEFLATNREQARYQADTLSNGLALRRRILNGIQ
jgi:hypothetical protein